MLALFTTPDREMRSAARGWLDLADKIHHYRRDQLPPADLADLQKKTETLRAQVREKAGAEKLKLSIESLEPVLRATGGKHYPRSTMLEWVEFLVVGLIVILAVRQFFFQPFQIPTNSMWPSYNGMVPEVHPTPADEPSPISRALRSFTLGAAAYRIDAPADGELLIPTALARTPTTGRQWLFFSQAQYEYDLYILAPNRTATKVPVSVPKDFDFSLVLRDAFGPQLDAAQTITDTYGRTFIRTRKQVRAGDRVLSFDIISGDRLFVDRLSYHFVRPSVGSGFVFRTTNIPGTTDSDGNHIESYYIKRLVGLPGDTLQIRPPMLYRNGAPITGAQAFYDNNHRAGKYRGYTNQGTELLRTPAELYTVSPRGYIACGDNSNNSADSRYWGEVPKKDITGRPLWVFYPFGPHWGPPR